MPRPPSPRIFRPALQVAATQVAVGVVAGVAWFAASARFEAGLAALAGGCVPALLNLYLALRLPQGDAVSPADFVAAFYRAQALKLGLATGLLALAVLLFRDQFLALITTLGLALTMHWFALLWAR